MNTTKEQQKELDDALVAPENRLKIGKSNLRLSSNLKSKEPTIQVVLDALKLTPFYNAFEISADVPEIYMQEFWVTVTRHHSSLRFKLDGKSHTVNVDNFRDMLKICPKLPGQKFEEPPLEEDILSFIRDLGHTGEIKFLSDVNVNHMHQPWRSFAAIINKCLSGKTTALESLLPLTCSNSLGPVSQQAVIVDYFMAKDQAIPRRNKMFWHYARDEFMFTTISVISKHKDTQEYGAILPQHLTNQAMLESEAFKTYRAYATESEAFKTYRAYDNDDDNDDNDDEDDDQENDSQRTESDDEGDDFVYLNLEFLVQMKELVTNQRFPMYPNTYQRAKKNPRLSVKERMRKKMRSMTLKSDKLREEAQAENQDFLNSLDFNMKRIIKEQVKAQTSKIMTKVEKYVTKTLGAEVLVRSTNQPQTSYVVASSLLELELKKILMDKMEENNYIDRSDVQKNLYRALLKAYNSDKDILSSYGEVVTLKKGRDDQHKDEENPRWQEEHDPRVDDLEEPFHQEFDTGNDDVSPVREATDVDERLWNPSGSRTPDREWNQTKNGTCPEPYPHDLSKPLPLILDVRGHLIIPYDHFINNDLEYLKGGSSSHKYTTSITKTKAADYAHIKWIEDKIPRSTYATNMETSKEVYSKHRIIAVTSLKIMEFFGYKHLEEITGKLTNLNVDERFTLNVALRMYTRRIVIQERVEDLQLAVESYKKKINLTKPNTYRSDISKKTPCTAYRDIQSIIYQDDMNINRLMRTDELHKFSNGTLNHVRTSLNDIATRIQMEYLLKRKWSKQDKQRARVMIKAIDKKLKYRRLMRSLEKFVGGRPYKGDLRLLQRTI
ncbi:hypothetical protein Tco_0222785 [Tanacetum coccineum]